MNESAARAFMLVRAIEANDAERRIWSDDDRAWATRAAGEVVGAHAAPDEFLSRRATLALERLETRHASIPRLLRLATWRPWITWAVVLIAFVAGVGTDQIGAGKRVDVLALPLLALLAWNLSVYVVVLLRWILAALGRPVVPGPIRRAVGRLGHATLAPIGGRESVLTRALTAFAGDWTHASMPLAAARIGRALHLAALAFALGLLAGMYTRGMVLEYRAGWESTFLDAHAVGTLLQVILGSASHLTGIPLPDTARLEAMRFGAGIGENAAPWLHLYAVTITLFVLLPRAALAAFCGLIARSKARRFLSADDDIYARRLVRQLRGDAAHVHVVPYAMDLAPAARDGLLSLMARVYGAKAAVEIAPSVAWGTEEQLSAQAVPAGLAALWALFALAATPERENHGVFLRALRERGAGTAPLLVLVDESAFRKRFADTPARLEERRMAWQSLLDECQTGAVFVDLEGIDLVAAENAMNAVLERVVQASA